MKINRVGLRLNLFRSIFLICIGLTSLGGVALWGSQGVIYHYKVCSEGADPLGTCDPEGCTGDCKYVVSSAFDCTFSLLQACAKPGVTPAVVGMEYPGKCELRTGVPGDGWCSCIKNPNGVSTPVLVAPNCW